MDFRTLARRAVGVAALATSLVVLPALAPSLEAASPGPFKGMDGLWAGTGTIKIDNGTKERLRCRAQYLVREDGNNLQQALRCTSDSYEFQVNSFINYKGGTISGNWSEVTNNVSGRLTGKASAGKLQASVDGGAFSAKMTLTTSATKQTVLIVPKGTSVTEVSGTLTRAR